MSERLMIDVGRVGDQFFCQLSGKQDGAMPFDIGATASAGDVQASGARIFDELCKNREVKKAIERALDGDSQPIYINATTIPAQAVRWEALWGAPAGFVSLDQRWPIARVAGADVARTPITFAQPLRILAVISAEGRPGEPEWRALQDAAEAATRSGLAVQIHVLTGEAALFQALQPPPANWITVAPVPATVDELSVEVGRFGPHVLHFFCHGQVDAGNAYLEIMGNNRELQLSIRDLLQIPGLDNVWLVVLNSCLGGASMQDYPSMAYRIVSDGKVPFAIGATENVEVRDANTFSRAFYNRLLFTFGEGIKKATANGVLTLEWGAALHAARRAISQAYQDKPATFHQWTLPILYEHRTRLQLIMQGTQKPDDLPAPAPDPAAALRVKMAAELLAALPPGTSEATKNSLVAAILNPPHGG
jgi:hypothetical protein